MKDLGGKRDPLPKAPELLRLVYASAAAAPMARAELEALLAKARSNNARLGVTGMLLYHEGSFIQALEGDPEVVDALYDRIAADPRHRDAMLLIREPAVERLFDDWTMGFYRVGPDSEDELPGLSHFLADPSELFGGRVEPDRVRKLLLGFREGLWRRVVEGGP